jgi:uncharacterized protein YacL
MTEYYEASSGAGAARAREPVRIFGELSTVDIIKDVVENIQGIFRSEIRLASAEMKEKATKASKALIVLAAGGVLMLFAFGFLLTFVFHALATVMWPWLSALIIFAGLAIAGLVMLSKGRSGLKRIKPKPEMTMERVKEDVQWLKTRTR